MAKKQIKKIQLSTILLYVVLALSIAHLTILALSFFSVLKINFLKDINFNYLVALILVAVCLILFILFLLIEKYKKLVMPEWFKSLFFIAFFVFTNVYYFFGLYSNLAGLIPFYICLAFFINIIALSIFFNTQKSDTNILKSTSTFTAFTTFTYAVAIGAIIETIISGFKIIFAKTSIYSTLTMIVADLCIIILVSAIMAIVYGLSLSKQKKIINGCLIKFYK